MRKRFAAIALLGLACQKQYSWDEMKGRAFKDPQPAVEYICQNAGPGVYTIDKMDVDKKKGVAVAQIAKISCAGDNRYYVHVEKSRTTVKTKRTGKLNILIGEKEISEQTHESAGIGISPITIDEITKVAKDKKILIVGEEHPPKKEGVLLSKILPKLKEAGFTHLGIEYPRDFELATTAEDKVMEFASLIRKFRGEISISKFITVDPQELYFSQETKTLFETADRSGLELFCFDMPTGEVRGNRTLDTTRERYMANAISEMVSKGHKVVVFTGTTHALNLTGQRSIIWIRKSNGGWGLATEFKVPHMAKILKETHGGKNVLTIDFSGCTTPFTDYCLE